MSKTPIFDETASGRKLVVIDANPLFQEGLSSICEMLGFKVLAGAATCESLCEIETALADADLCLVGFPLLEDEIETSVRSLRLAAPKSRIVLLADNSQADQFGLALQAGVDGLLMKTISTDVLRESLKLILLDQKIFPVGMLQAPSVKKIELANATANSEFSHLSQREHQVLMGLMDGGSNKQIARTLSITEATVKIHLKSILRKTRSGNRTQAAVWALQKGLKPLENCRI